MVTATAATYQRAITRAQRRGGLRAVRELGGDTYGVVGTLGTDYRVQDLAGELTCSCPAGLLQVPCWHIAAVHLLKVARAAVWPVGERESVQPAGHSQPSRESAAELRERLRAESRANVTRWGAESDDLDGAA